jgi:polar amino acid transport system substrate-binding protein
MRTRRIANSGVAGMNSTIRPSGRRAGTGLIGLTLLGLLAAACGGGATTSSNAAVSGLSKVTSIASEVPADIRSKGAIQVATDATYAPNEFVDPASGEIKGWDIDLAHAVSTVLGMPFVISNADFSTIIPDLGTRYDISFSSFTPTAQREMTVDFVTYYKAGESWITKKGGLKITMASEMCGHTVAVETGTVEESDAWGYLGKKPDGSAISGDTDNCTAAGKPDITVHSFTKQTEADSDLLSGRSDVGWSDQPVAYYQGKLNNQLTVSGAPCSVAPYGIAVAKNNGLVKPLTDAIKYLIDNGYYTKILKSWNVEAGGIKSSEVALNNNNTSGSSCVPTY